MQLYDAPRGGDNSIGFTHIDHITSNFQTMAPTLLWLQHVLGLRELWEVEFHTRDVAKYEVREGSGLRSKVMWDPSSGIKFANNEPYRPAFRYSQINQFVEDHRGDGIQHAALATHDIIAAVRKLRERGVEFMSTPHTYYEQLPERLAALGIAHIDEPIETLQELEILVDGHGPGRYLLQIFVKDSAALYREAPAGPFFFELIQRKGDEGFGAGNFRALFESIERAQKRGGGA
jgi:4-hydroxyphenylpyruvate dioxygenase